MKKDELIKLVATKQEVSNKEATETVNVVLDAIVEGLEQDGIVDITKFAKFEVKETKARDGRNPSTGEPMAIPAGKRIAIKPLKALKDIVGK